MDSDIQEGFISKVRIKTKIVNCLCKDEFIHLKRDDKVIVDMGTDKEFGSVFCSPQKNELIPNEVYPEVIDSSLTRSEEEIIGIFRLEKEMVRFCEEKIKTYHLEMEVLKAEYSVDTTRVIVYFTAEKRIDFRELVKDANHHLKGKTRIELWQISAREKAVLIGGIGICGREICCRSIGKIPETVSIRTVKDQHLDINPLKITGLCGKLMCCLTYEHSVYCEMSKNFPKVGKKVIVNQKAGFIKSLNILKGTVIVEFEEKITMECKLNEFELITEQQNQ